MRGIDRLCGMKINAPPRASFVAIEDSRRFLTHWPRPISINFHSLAETWVACSLLSLKLSIPYPPYVTGFRKPSTASVV